VLTKTVARIMLVNVIGLFLSMLDPALVYNLQLIPARLPTAPWTLITYQFLHAGFAHLFFNMLGLYFFGPRLEARLGSRAFLGLYLVSGLVGAIVHIGYAAAFSPIGLIVPMVGASGAVFGVLLAYSKFWPDHRILLWFVLPMRARVFVLVLTMLSLWSGLGGAGDNVAHFAHLGGFVGGWLYLRWRETRSPAQKFKREVERNAPSDTRRLSGLWKKINPEKMHWVNRGEYDRIKTKLDEAGFASLTEREKAFITRFSA